MSKKREFIEFIEKVMDAAKVSVTEMPEDARIYWEAFKTTNDEAEKSEITDNGKIMIKFMQDHPETTTWKARDIAEGLFVTSRKVSGSMRKLVSDGYVERLGQDPIVYALTEKGKTTIID